MMYATLPFLGSKREDKDTAARTSDAIKLLGVCRVLGFEGKISSCQVTGDSKERGIETTYQSDRERVSKSNGIESELQRASYKERGIESKW